MSLATIPRPPHAPQLAPLASTTIHPTKREQTVLARQVRRGNSRSREELILRNLRLVYAIARRYAGSGLEMEDLIQEGTIGLIRAVDKFDPERGVAFSTYATWWIRQSIGRALDNTARLIRIPSHLISAAAAIRQASLELDGRVHESTVAAVAHTAGVESDICVALLQATATPISVDAPARSESDTTLGELIADRSPLDPETAAVRQEVRDAIRRLLDHLPPRDRAIICARFGLNENEKPETLDVVAERYHLSAERIRQIEARALARLRHVGRIMAVDVLAREGGLL